VRHGKLDYIQHKTIAILQNVLVEMEGTRTWFDLNNYSNKK